MRRSRNRGAGTGTAHLLGRQSGPKGSTVTTRPSGSTPRHICARTIKSGGSDTCGPMFAAAAALINNKKRPRSPPTDEWLNKTWYTLNHSRGLNTWRGKSQPQKHYFAWLHLSEKSRAGKSRGGKEMSGRPGPRGWRGRGRVNGPRVSRREDKNIFKLDCGDGCTTLWIH